MNRCRLSWTSSLVQDQSIQLLVPRIYRWWAFISYNIITLMINNMITIIIIIMSTHFYYFHHLANHHHLVHHHFARLHHHHHHHHHYTTLGEYLIESIISSIRIQTTSNLPDIRHWLRWSCASISRYIIALPLVDCTNTWYNVDDSDDYWYITPLLLIVVSILIIYIIFNNGMR